MMFHLDERHDIIQEEIPKLGIQSLKIIDRQDIGRRYYKLNVINEANQARKYLIQQAIPAKGKDFTFRSFCLKMKKINKSFSEYEHFGRQKNPRRKTYVGGISGSRF